MGRGVYQPAPRSGRAAPQSQSSRRGSPDRRAAKGNIAELLQNAALLAEELSETLGRSADTKET